MNKILLFAAVLIAAPAFAQNVSFKNGNDLSIITYAGNLELNCFGALSRYVPCSGEDVQPGVEDVLVSSAPIDADHVILFATHPNGKQTAKRDISYDAKSGRSGSINLLISTLLQRPLLSLGKNEIGYTFKKGSQTVSTGSFEAIVEIAAQLKCPGLTLIGTPNECQIPNNALACDDYFDRVQNCR